MTARRSLHYASFGCTALCRSAWSATSFGKQVLRSATSVAANYREAGRGRTKAELASKLSIVLQELDETQLWLELLVEAGFVKEAKLRPLQTETEELIRIMVASIRTITRKPD